MAQLNSTYEFPLWRTLVDSALWAMFWGVLVAALTVFGAEAAAFVFVAAQGWFLGTKTSWVHEFRVVLQKSWMLGRGATEQLPRIGGLMLACFLGFFLWQLGIVSGIRTAWAPNVTGNATTDVMWAACVPADGKFELRLRLRGGGDNGTEPWTDPDPAVHGAGLPSDDDDFDWSSGGDSDEGAAETVPFSHASISDSGEGSEVDDYASGFAAEGWNSSASSAEEDEQGH
jgi:hypothetical protein